MTTETVLNIMPRIRPSLTDEIVMEFEKDSVSYSRV